MKQSVLHQIIAYGLCLFIISSALGASAQQFISTTQSIENVEIIKDHIDVPTPRILENNNKISVAFSEVESWLLIPGNPKIPMITEVYTFPLGTAINDITCDPTSITEVTISSPVESVPAFQSINGDKTLGLTSKNPEIYASTDPYPETWYDVRVGGGLDKDNSHVTIVTVQIYPYRYSPASNLLTTASEFDLVISVQPNDQEIVSVSNDEVYDLVIITPSQYINDLSVLQDHKELCGLSTIIKSTNEIYNQYSGRDPAEKIKYFIKYAVENYQTTYVLLVGDIKQLPIRSADAYPWEGYHGNGLLSDLYYADLYDATGAFCTWDSNNNNIFGEVTMENFPPFAEDLIDKVDLYADVHIGRIPCSTNDELITMINKIITYEQVTYDQIWFQKIILAGGDTFPLTKGSPFNVFEGEITNVKVGQQLPGFEKVFLWASEKNLNAKKFNDAISEGAGFVSYAGHGFEHGWGTYRPNAIIDGNLIIYYSPFIKGIDNEHRLPIVFFDACLTAKFDFNISDLIGYYGLKARIVNLLLGRYTPDEYFSPFAWSFIKHERGGGIAAVGATRPAYTFVDKDGVYAGAGYLDVHFFKAYEEGVTAGEMLTRSQFDYINNVGFDVFTIEEYELLGDPSLRVGGYPDGAGNV